MIFYRVKNLPLGMIYLFTSYGFSRQHVHAAAEKAKDGDDEEALGAVVEAEEQVKQVKDLYLDHKTPHLLNMVGMEEMV